MAKYSETAINEIKRRLTITDVVSDYVSLSRKGDRLWGLCPFHNEKTPSFTVVEDKGFYKCFGCGKGGSMFDFIMEVNHLDFVGALQFLAKKAGVQLKEESAQEKQIRTDASTLMELNQRLAKTFHYLLLNSPSASHARDYLASRAISMETIEKFLLGFAPADTNWLYNFLLKNNYSKEFLTKSGLFSQKSPTWPLFANRIVFPVRDWQGQVIAFSGRDLSNSPKAPKYINSPDTLVYNKKDNVFGIYEAIASIKEEKRVIFCEGNFDVISMHQAGLGNTVAPLGTAFTAEQAKLVMRYAERAVLMFDSDEAGQHAIEKGLLLCQQKGLEASVMNLGQAKDASEVLQNEGTQELKNKCVNSLNGFDYLVHLALKRYDIRKPKAKALVFKEVRPFLEATTSNIERQAYIKRLADILGVTESQITEDFESTGKNSSTQPTDGATIINKLDPIAVGKDLYLMLLILNHRDYFSKVRNELSIGMLENDDAKKIYSVLEDSQRFGYETNEALIAMFDDENLKALVSASLIDAVFTNNENFVTDINKSIVRIKLRELQKKRLNAQMMLRLNEENDSNALQLLAMIRDYDDQIQKIKSKGLENEEIDG